METKHRRKQMLGALAILIGAVVALNLVRVLAIRALSGHTITAWLFVYYLLVAGIAAYLLRLGWRTIQLRSSTARFGWGRLVFGAWMVFDSVNEYLHFMPFQRPRWGGNPSGEAEVTGYNFGEAFFFC